MKARNLIKEYFFVLEISHLFKTIFVLIQERNAFYKQQLLCVIACQNHCFIRNEKVFEITMHELANQSYGVFCTVMQLLSARR